MFTYLRLAVPELHQNDGQVVDEEERVHQVESVLDKAAILNTPGFNR